MSHIFIPQWTTILRLRFLVTFAVLFAVMKATAQCPPGNVKFTSQAQIDNFIIEYPNCTEINGHLDVDNADDATNLDGLKNIVRVKSDLNLVHNAALNNLDGLRNIKFVGRNLWIADNSALNSVDVFTELDSVISWLYIGDHPLLTQISAFSNLKYCGLFSVQENMQLQSLAGFSAVQRITNFTLKNNPQLSSVANFSALPRLLGSLTIDGNASLTNIAFLSSVTTISAGVQIQNNTILNNLDGLDNLTQIGGNLQIINNGQLDNISGIQHIAPASITGLTIQNNTSLSLCDIPVICTYLEGNGPRSISGNAGDCATEQDVLDACSSPECPEFAVFLSTQAAVDKFKQDYPNCTYLTVNVYISGGDITNLDGLSNIQGTTHNIEISNTTALTNVDGLSSLQSMGGYLLINNNTALTNLNGLNSLQSLSGSLWIDNNTALADISGIKNIDPTILPNLRIQGNTMLNVCDLPNICTYLSTNKPRSISGNAGNCLSEQVVLNICNGTPCPSGNVSLTTQAEVNQFALDYPDCTELPGNVYIGTNPTNPASDIVDLTPLNKITTINGYLAIYNTSLTSFNGLQNLKSILLDLDIRSNANLVDLSELQNTTFNPDGNFGLTITNNPLLSVCNLPNFCTYLANNPTTHPRQISGNAGDCISNQAVIDACSANDCIITVPDPNFKNYLLSHTGINTNGDNEIQCAEAAQFTGPIQVPFLNIADLTGIEHFSNISYLDCGGNQLTSLNLNANKKLTVIAVATNNLTTLLVNECTLLERLYCEVNQLTTLNLSNNLALTTLFCQANQLSSLDFSKHTAFKELNCSNNVLNQLNVKNGNNTSFIYLITEGNSSLQCIQVDDPAYSIANWTGGAFIFDVHHEFKEDCGLVEPIDGDLCSSAIDIQFLFGQIVDEPQLSGTYYTEGMTSGDEPNEGSECLRSETATVWFTFTGDGDRYYIRSRDCNTATFVDPNGALYEGNCGELSGIGCHSDIWLGDEDPDANFHFTLKTEAGKKYYIIADVISYDEDFNPSNFGSLCMEVTRLGAECIVAIPDPNFKAYLVNNTEINKNLDDEIQCEEAEKYYGSIECNGLNISDMTGLQAFVNLIGLNCSNNNLNTLDISAQLILDWLNCADNNLSVLDVSKNNEIYSLDCSGNKISLLDLSNLYRLQELNTSNNLIGSLDISKSSILGNINCNNNLLYSLNLANGYNKLATAIKAHDNANLTCIKVDDAVYSESNWRSGDFMFDTHHEFDTMCNECYFDGEILDARFLVSSSACAGDSIRFIDYTTGLETPQMGFSWDFGNGKTSLERDPIYVYTVPGQYEVRLKLEVPTCDPIFLTKKIDILACRKDVSTDQSFAILYPNPTSGQFNIGLDMPEDGPIAMRVLNSQGFQVFSSYKFAGKNDILTFNIEEAGLYLIEINHLFSTQYIRLVIVH